MEYDDCDLPGELDVECAWCGCDVLDRNATVINGRRFCVEPCAEEYRRDVAGDGAEETDGEGDHGEGVTGG